MAGSSDTVDELATSFRQLSLDNDPPQPTHQVALKCLPDDVLYHLFLFMEASDRMESLMTVVRLSHVCAHWRAVILHAPLLWTYVKLSWTRKQINHSPVVESFLRRSKHLPVAVHLVLDVPLEAPIFEWSRALSPHARRFQELVTVVHAALPIDLVLPAVLTSKMSRLTRFDLAVLDHHHCTIEMKPRFADHAASCGDHLLIAKTSTSYLDWTVRNFHITSLSLKYLDLPVSDLFPILIMTQSTLERLEYYNITVEDRYHHCLPRLALPKLTSLSVGYSIPRSASSFVDRLILPNLCCLFVHDFGRCPESRTPWHLQCEPCSDAEKDARELLVALCPFTKVSSLTLRGVTCFASTFEEVMLPLKYLFEGLESLVLAQCDSQFLHILLNVTLDSDISELESLSELVITSNDYPLVMDYLRLRAARGLPRLKVFSVNPRMALLRHFYREFATDFLVRGQVRHRASKASIATHPYPRELRPARMIGAY
ncbi:hypothetical protein LshimejAT787_1203630 [Lyophyllum shimeji]|uniref:F-box domain-containing protein n=1 Tax=Lyophyllum shimeji TaxID=47721 RepID=A0A9P3PWR7_LYOSH|nr:hypothetical protein LshimejAT787_1203630 [Lyophyllum shimeji]